MKHKLRNSIVFLIHILGISVLYRAWVRSRGPLVRVIAFHDVADAGWFTAVIEMFAKKYHILTPSEFHAQEFNTEKINILLTFDDGYLSWTDICLPILNARNLKGLFFLNSGLLDIAEDKDTVSAYMKNSLRISPKAALTWEKAASLIALGHSVGGHSMTHRNMALLDDEELKNEIVRDKERIEAKLGVPLSDFAYPFGTRSFFTDKTIEAVAGGGYRYQYLAITGFIKGQNKPIARTLIEKNQKVSHVQRWVDGGYDIFSFIKL